MANTIENLKKIFEIQKEGVLLEMLREVRNAKSEIDTFSKKLATRKKQLEINALKVEQPKEVENKPETIEQPTVKPEIKKEETSLPNFVDGQKSSQNNYRKFDNQDRNQNRGNFQNNRFNNSNQRDFRNINNNFNRQGQNNGNRNFGNKPFSPNGQNRPQGNFNRPMQNGGKRPNGANFVSTKVNSFRSFDSLDSLEVKQQERTTFGQKGKTNKRVQTDERKNKRFADEGRSYNILIEDENGFEEGSFGSRKGGIKKKKESSTIVAPAITKAVITTSEVTIKELSEKIGKPVTDIVKKLMLLGVMATINSSIDFDTAELVSTDLGVELELKLDKTFEEKLIESSQEDDQEKLVKRPPIVTVMGHVDHGKTSLLDAFRQTNVVAGEAGGITQSIGAYQISFNGEKITFIDTPGHAAFTAMRARGAKATDIAILVVAADDGIMPQTIEAINHIKAANVPMIVAVNKMDKPEANPDRVKQQLTEHGVLPEEWGGDTIVVPISAKTGLGLDKLKETILLVAEMQELKANPDKTATGVVIEAELDKNKGPVASILIHNGTLHVGDNIMSGITFGKVRAMYNEHGKQVKTAGPSTPVSILGFNEVPVSGDQVYAANESLSKQVIQERIDKIKKERAKETSGVTLDNFMNKVHEGTLKNLNIIIKADTMGSVEALKATLLPIANEEAKVNVIHSGAGAVTESDVILAQTTGAIIICFNQKPVPKAKALADSQKIEIKEYKIIYEIVDDITNAISGMMTIKYEEKYIGYGEILMVFKLSTAGKVAGSAIRDGKVIRNCIAKVTRNGEEIGSSTVDSLKIVKDEKAEVAKGYECGIKMHDDIDIKEGDRIDFYVKEPIKRK